MGRFRAALPRPPAAYFRVIAPVGVGVGCRVAASRQIQPVTGQRRRVQLRVITPQPVSRAIEANVVPGRSAPISIPQGLVMAFDYLPLELRIAHVVGMLADPILFLGRILTFVEREVLLDRVDVAQPVHRHILLPRLLLLQCHRGDLALQPRGLLEIALTRACTPCWSKS